MKQALIREKGKWKVAHNTTFTTPAVWKVVDPLLPPSAARYVKRATGCTRHCAALSGAWQGCVPEGCTQGQYTRPVHQVAHTASTPGSTHGQYTRLHLVTPGYTSPETPGYTSLETPGYQS